jgi:hypothetical protein
LDFSLNIIDGIRGFDFESDGFTREAKVVLLVQESCKQDVYARFHKNLHIEYGSFRLSNVFNDGVFEESKSRFDKQKTSLQVLCI